MQNRHYQTKWLVLSHWINHLVEALYKNGIPLHVELSNHNLIGIFQIKETIELKDFDMIIYFDGSYYGQGGWVGVVFVIPNGVPMSVSFKLS